MKVAESYWKDTAAVWKNTNTIINVKRFLTSLQVMMQNFIRPPNERAQKSASEPLVSPVQLLSKN